MHTRHNSSNNNNNNDNDNDNDSKNIIEELRSSSRSRGIAQLSMIRANRLEAPASVSTTISNQEQRRKENSPSKIEPPLILLIRMPPIRLLLMLLRLLRLLRLSILPQPR